MLTLNDIKKLANNLGVDISNHILSKPINTQQKIAQEMGFDNFDNYVHDMLNQLKEKTTAPKRLTARQYLDNLEPNQRWHGAGYLGRVFGNDMLPQEVLESAGYNDKEIAEFLALKL